MKGKEAMSVVVDLWVEQEEEVGSGRGNKAEEEVAQMVNSSLATRT